MWNRLLLCSLVLPGAIAHAEPLAALEPVAWTLDAGTTGQSGPDAASGLIVTSFRADPIEKPAEDRLASSGPLLSLRASTQPRRWTDHAAGGPYRSLGSKLGQIKWETLGFFGYFTAINGRKLFQDTESFHFQNEGWFGKSTTNLGVDKLTHAYDSYILADFLHYRLHRKTDGARGDAVTAALVASGLMIYSELSDGIETDGGFSFQDVAMNSAGAAFSILRNTVPGLREKLDFRLLLMPNSDVYTRAGKRHYRQQRFLLALKLSGFERFENTPLRFVELHAGYYASGFTHQEIAKGEQPRRHLFFGVGLNLRELFFRQPRSSIGQVVGTGLNYLQLPYTAIHRD